MPLAGVRVLTETPPRALKNILIVMSSNDRAVAVLARETHRLCANAQ